MKYNGTLSKQQINQYTLIDYALMDRYTYYPSPLLVFGSNGYSKHYFIEGQRVMSRIGDVWDAEAALIPLDTTPDGVDLNNKADQIEAQLETHLVCLALEGEVDYHVDLEWLGWETEPMVFFYHPDHLGSSSFITGATGEPTQHLEYLPFGELFIEERSTWNTPYKFSGKELDDETGYSYFGARYYDPNISIWLSVDPHADNYPNASPYCYVENNPIMRIDPDGRDWYESESGAVLWQKGDASNIEINGEKFNNIGTTYTQNIGNGVSIGYTQNEATSITFEAMNESQFTAQGTGTGCKIACENMLEKTGNRLSGARIDMVNSDANGVATTPTKQANKGMNLLNAQLENGNPVIVGVDYKAKQVNNIPPNGDGMTDHFVVIGSKTETLSGGQVTGTSYRFFDPRSIRNGASSINTMSFNSGGRLSGSYNHSDGNYRYTVTTIRGNR